MEKLTIEKLEKLMVEHGIVIRAIPYEHVDVLEISHKDKHPGCEVYFDEICNREMIKVTKKNSKGGKFIVTTEATQGTKILGWGKKSREWGKKNPVGFYDTIEEAIASLGL